MSIYGIGTEDELTASSVIDADRRHPWPRTIKAGVGAIAMGAALASLVPVTSEPAGAEPTPPPGFRHVGQLTIKTGLDLSDGGLLMDPVHRRAYAFAMSPQGPVEVTVFDLDTFVDGRMLELPPIVIPPAQVGNGGVAVRSVLWERLVAFDPLRQRIIYQGSDGLYEVEAGAYNPDTGGAPVHKWVIPPQSGNQSVDGVINRGNGLFGTAISPQGINYDAGDAGHPERVYVIGANAAKTVAIEAFDASPGALPPGQPEGRLAWVYRPSSCIDLDRGGAPFDVQTQALVIRSGDWLYAYCNGNDDRSARGVMRVRLSGSPPQPDPDTEEFFPGVTGKKVHPRADSQSGRVYLAVTNERESTRSVLVFDGAIAQSSEGAGGATMGAYIGEIALIQDPSPGTREGIDPTTGRWYVQTNDGLWYQDGRLRRVAQANKFPKDQGDGSLEGESGNWRPLYVDPAVPGVRGARVFVYRMSADPRCKAPGQPCYDVYEDTSPLPGQPPSPDERTLNEPEAPGKVGVYAGVTSAYGLRVRLTRGFSSAWPSSGGPVRLDDDRSSPPKSPNDYVTDPFFYHSGECGSKDREITFGRVSQTQLSGGLLDRDASAAALAVDPDVHRPSAPDDLETRTNYEHPDECSLELLRTLTLPMCRVLNPEPHDQGCADDKNGNGTPDAEEPPDQRPPEDNNPDDYEDGAEQFLGGTSAGIDAMWNEEWPYTPAACSGDAVPPPMAGSLGGSGFVPGSSEVKCAANNERPSVEASSRSGVLPDNALVRIDDTSASTRITRRQNEGLLSEAHVVVRGITVAGAVHLDAMVIDVTAEAQGYATPEASTAKIAQSRQFLGLTVAGQPLCAVCDPAQVVDAMNDALGGLGYARAADPERDYTLGTVKGTLAVVQKDLQLQDADATTNRDFATEWPGLEIVVYRDAEQRGLGRWAVQFGGVFAQAQFGVIEGFGDLLPDDEEVEEEADGREREQAGALATRADGAGQLPGEEPVTYAVTYAIAIPADAAAHPAPLPPAERGFLEQVAQALKKGLGAALLLFALWTLVYSPVILARRRQLLRNVMEP